MLGSSTPSADRPSRGLRCGAVLVMILIFAPACVEHPADRPEHSADPPERSADMPGFVETHCPVSTAARRTALRAGVRWLRAVSRPRTDAAWVLRTVARSHPELHIAPIDPDRTSDPSAPGRSLVDPGAYDAPPPAATRADQALQHDVAVAFTAPGPSRNAALDAFTAQSGLDGYALTHQWLSLLWAKEVGGQVPDALWDRREQFAARVREDLRSTSALDLYAEQVALLVNDGPPPTEADTERWSCQIVAQQRTDGSWRPSGSVLQQYRLGAYAIAAEPEHTTALAVWFLSGIDVLAAR